MSQIIEHSSTSIESVTINAARVFTVVRSMKSLNDVLHDSMDLLLITNVFPYISSIQELINLSSSCKRFRKLIFSTYCTAIWDKLLHKPFEICIDGYCPTCHFKQIRGTIPSAVQFLSSCPLKKIQMHCFLTDIPKTLAALAKIGTLEYLDLNVTNKANSPALEFLLSVENMPQISNLAFLNLKEFILDSAHLNHVRLAGRAKLLDILGSSLKYLSFRNLSPSKVFSILDSTRCPQLKRLRVDKAITVPDLMAFRSDILVELELWRCNFALPELQLSALKRLRYSTLFRLEASQIHSIISTSIPKTLQELSIEIPSSLVNLTISTISKNLRSLKQLAIEGSHETGLIERQAMYKLGRRCVNLHTVQFLAKSVNSIGFDSLETATVLGVEFPELKCFRFRCDEIILHALPMILETSRSLKKISLWQRRKWIDEQEWIQQEQMINALHNQYPHVLLYLEEL